MRRPQRLTQRRDIRRVQRQGRALRGTFISVRMFHSSAPTTRYAFSAGRQVGGAVKRNRVKRRLREAARSLKVSPGWNVLVSLRPEAATARFQQLCDELQALLFRAGLIRADAP